MCIYIYIIICTNIPGWSVAPGWSSFPVLRSTWTGQKPWSATSSGSGWGDLGEPNDWSPSGCVNGIYGIHWLIQINHHSPKIGNSLDISLFRWPIAPEAAAREIRQETETAVRPGVPWSTKRQVFWHGMVMTSFLDIFEYCHSVLYIDIFISGHYRGSSRSSLYGHIVYIPHVRSFDGTYGHFPLRTELLSDLRACCKPGWHNSIDGTNS